MGGSSLRGAKEEEISLSDVVIKADNIQMVDSARRSSPGFSKFSFDPRGNGLAVKKDRAPLLREKVPQENMEEKIKAAEAEAYAKGFSEGMTKGAEMERVNLHSTVETLSAAFRELSRLKTTILEKSEGEILTLAFSIAEKILHQEISTNKDVATAVLKSAMKDILDREGLKILLSPRDYRHMTEVNPEAISSIEGLRNAELEADETIGPGGVVIETLFGEVDARIDRQLNEIKEALSGQE